MASEKAVGALSGAASGAAAGTAILPGWGTAIGAVVGGIAGLFSSSKKPKYEPLDINKIITDARTQASENYKNSIALEGQYRPGTAALRGYTDIALANLAAGNTPGAKARDSLLSGLTSPSNSLLQESADSILQSLRLGASLPAEVQAQITRSALSTGGQAGLTGSRAGAGLVARDIGLTGLALQQQRQQQAFEAGNVLEQLGLSRLNAAQAAANSDADRTGLLAGIIDARALPESGLSAGSVADLFIADNNARNQIGATNASISAQQNASLFNSLLGFGSSMAGMRGVGGGVGSGTSSAKVLSGGISRV